jgi:hypothetical protein
MEVATAGILRLARGQKASMSNEIVKKYTHKHIMPLIISNGNLFMNYSEYKE